MLSQTGQRVGQLDIRAPRPGDQLASRLELEASAGGRRRSDPFNYIPVSDAEPIAATRLQLLNGVRRVRLLAVDQRTAVDRFQLRQLLEDLARGRLLVDPADQVPAGVKGRDDRVVGCG